MASPLYLPSCFRATSQGRFRVFLRRGLEEALTDLLAPLETLWQRLERATPVARGRGDVALWPLAGRPERAVLRRYAHGGLAAGLLGHLLWGQGRAVRELAMTERAREADVAAPVALAAVVERLFGPVCRAVLVTAEVQAAEDMVHFCRRLADEQPRAAAGAKRRAIIQAARQVRGLHQAGIEHADLHLKNLLVHPGPDGKVRVAIIDFDGARQRPPETHAFRLRNLMRLARSARKVRAARQLLTVRDRLRFLREYLRGEPEADSIRQDWIPRLAQSGRLHERWWRLIRADREPRGDRLGP